MKILKEAVLFFALVLVLVVGATLLSRYSPEGKLAVEPPQDEVENATFEAPAENETQAVLPERQVSFTANLYYNISGVQVNMPASTRDLSFTFTSPEAPLRIGDQRLSTEGEHSLEIKDFDGPISFMLRESPTIELFGSLKSLRLDDYLFDADEAIILQTPKLSVSSLSVSEAEIDHLILKLESGTVQLTDPPSTVNLQPGNSLDVVNFKGKFEFERVTGRVTLTGTASKLTAYSVRHGKSTEVRIS